MTARRGNLLFRPGIVAGKCIATIAAIIAALAIGGLVVHLSDLVNDLITSQILYRPGLLRPRLDVICALLIPIFVVLWWQPSSRSSNSNAVVACCLGIGAGFVPIVMQILSWPFIYHSPEGVQAAAAVAVFTAASLSYVTTRRHLKTNSDEALAKPVVPNNIRRGLIRLYIVLVVPWVIWFGYAAHAQNAQITFDYTQSEKAYRSLAWLNGEWRSNDVDADLQHKKAAIAELEVQRRTWGASTNEDLIKRIKEETETDRPLLDFTIYKVLVAIIVLPLYPVFVWLIAGFLNLPRDGQ
jgi:uncharacterized membrane protein (DUF485 family)